MTEWPQALVGSAAIESAVSVHVHEPFSSARPKDADPDSSRAIPVSGNREIPLCAEFAKTVVQPAAAAGPARAVVPALACSTSQ